MSHISAIKLPDNSTYDIKDSSAIAMSEKGAANGVVPLNASSQINSTYLPSYVDDVIEGYYYNEKFWKESTHTTEIIGEAGKIYINLENNPATTYRYSGNAFVEIASGGSVVTITRDLTSGTKSATINVNGTNYDLYSTNDTTYESKNPVSGGIDVSLVTTGDKYNWNNKSSATNWLNGSQIGSVRTSGSAAESTDYTIGSYATAEGRGTKASGNRSHAEGFYTEVAGPHSHAEGENSIATGTASHVEGSSSIASGDYSHAGGRYTIAQRKSQTAIGEFNIADTTGTDGTARGSYAFIIGNGTSSSARSNALTVDWDGNVKIALDSTQITGTDYELYQAINSLGWTSDVIE